MALTMTDEQEREMRAKVLGLGDWPTFGMMTRVAVEATFAELDATRARVAELEAAALRDQRETHARLSTLVQEQAADLAAREADNVRLRERLAAAERELDEARDKRAHETQHLLNCCAERDRALAAREAECVELWAAAEALRVAVTSGAKYESWVSACERFIAILSRPPGSREALRAWGVEVAKEVHRSLDRVLTKGGAPETNAAIVARLLELATQAQGETPS